MTPGQRATPQVDFDGDPLPPGMARVGDVIGPQEDFDAMSSFPIRAGAVTDRSFIFDSWRHSYWDAPAVKGMGRDQYFADMGKRVEAMLDRTAVLVAHDPSDPDIIVGWACVEPPAVHYVFVRKDFRGLGIARALLTSIEGLTTFTHWSRGLRSAPATMIYRPYWSQTP